MPTASAWTTLSTRILVFSAAITIRHPTAMSETPTEPSAQPSCFRQRCTPSQLGSRVRSHLALLMNCEPITAMTELAVDLHWIISGEPCRFPTPPFFHRDSLQRMDYLKS